MSGSIHLKGIIFVFNVYIINSDGLVALFRKQAFEHLNVKPKEKFEFSKLEDADPAYFSNLSDYSSKGSAHGTMRKSKKDRK